MFEATCPGCDVTASPYDAACPSCGASLRVPCRDCGSLVHVADAVCYGCDAAWPADTAPRTPLAPSALGAAPGSLPAPALPVDPLVETAGAAAGRRSTRRLAPFAGLVASAIVLVSGAVLVATSGGDGVPTGGVSSAGAEPIATPTTTAPVTPAVVERDRLSAELQYGLAMPEPVARCVADAARAALGDAAFVEAHLALTGDAPDAGHAALDPLIETARPSCAGAGDPAATVPAPPGG